MQFLHMKVLKRSLVLIAFLTLIVFANCGGTNGDDTPPDQLALQADAFAIEWELVAEKAILVSAPQSNYNGLTLSVTGDRNGGSFTTNVNSLSDTSTDVWPESSDWAFSSDDGDTTNPASGYVLRSADGIVCAINVTNEMLVVNFTVGASSSRSQGIEGSWTFTFVPVDSTN